MSKNTEDQIKLTKVRLVYPDIIEPASWVIDGVSTPLKYGATFILNKQTHAKEINKINSKIDEVLSPLKVSKEKLIQKGYKYLPLRDGEIFDKEEYENSYILKSSSKFKPSAVAKDGKTHIVDNDVFYSGCYVNAYVQFWAYTKPEIGVACNILAIQFAADGDLINTGAFDIKGKFDSLDSSDDEDFEAPF